MSLILVDTTKWTLEQQMIDSYRDFIVDVGKGSPSTIIGVGGGSTLDSAKAVAKSWLYQMVEKLRIIKG